MTNTDQKLALIKKLLTDIIPTISMVLKLVRTRKHLRGTILTTNPVLKQVHISKHLQVIIHTTNMVQKLVAIKRLLPATQAMTNMEAKLAHSKLIHQEEPRNITNTAAKLAAISSLTNLKMFKDFIAQCQQFRVIVF